jgi:hypothetical protein
MSRGWPGDSVVLQSETIAQACPDDFKDDLLPEERDELLRAQLMSERDVRVEAHAATEPSTADRFVRGSSFVRTCARAMQYRFVQDRRLNAHCVTTSARWLGRG